MGDAIDRVGMGLAAQLDRLIPTPPLSHAGEKILHHPPGFVRHCQECRIKFMTTGKQICEDCRHAAAVKAGEEKPSVKNRYEAWWVWRACPDCKERYKPICQIQKRCRRCAALHVEDEVTQMGNRKNRRGAA